MSTLLNINNYHYRRGGADVAYLNQSELFASHGWRVASFAMKHPDNVDSPWSGYFADEIELGHRYDALRTLTNAAKSIYSWEAAEKITRLVRDVRPDVAHAHNVYHHLSPSVLKAVRQQSVPVFLTLHDVKLLCPARQMLSHGLVCEACKPNRLHHVVAKRCMKSSLALSSLIYLESTTHHLLNIYDRAVHRFVAPSRFLIDKFVEWGWPRKRFEYIPNYIDPAQFEPVFAPGKAFLYFGRLSAEKGLRTLITAAQMAGAPLWIVGTGPEDAALRTHAARLRADVQFFGFKSGDALWQLIRDCRAMVIPSEWYENAPISILEAYALGKPVIGARIGGIPEMIVHEATGLLHASGDAEAIAACLRDAATRDDASIEAWGRAGRARVLSHYSPAQHYSRLVALYRSAGVDTHQ